MHIIVGSLLLCMYNLPDAESGLHLITEFFSTHFKVFPDL